MNINVSIIIVNYNTSELLRDCLNSIYENTKNINFEIIVVDNDSKDNSRILLEKEFPYVKTIFSETNLGFGKANNLGVKYAEGEYVFFLNSDTIIHNNAVKLFCDFMYKQESLLNIGALGCLLTNSDGKIGFSYGVFPTVKNEFFYILGKLRIIKTENTNMKRKLQYFNVDFVSGAAMFIRKELFVKTGGFDPEIFMYYEETDLQKILKTRGYQNIIITTPHIVHLEGGSSKTKRKISFNTLCFSQKSMNYYIKKHFKGINYYFFRFYITIDRLIFLPRKSLTFDETKKYLKILFS